jgi:poly(3-hydroxybutyrate) depolymerase
MSVRKSFFTVFTLLFAMISLSFPLSSYGADSLGSYKINVLETSVSGISSGAYMADQFHIAFSSTVMGAGLIAGGPYNCAENSLMNALQRCMQTSFFYGAPDGKLLAENAAKDAKQGKIDDLSNLNDNKVYIFHGTNDSVVTQKVTDEIGVFYKTTGLGDANIKYVNDRAAGHAILTKTYGNACDTAASSPYISKCNQDQAGELLNHIFANKLKEPSSTLSGKMISFEQNEFMDKPLAHSMDKVGYAYIPKSCAEGTECRVHIAFHGCSQGVSSIGEEFINHAGYNRWADTNDMIILYPQVTNATSANPKGCWDFWGYDGAEYYTKKGNQMAGVKAMLDRLSGMAQPLSK